MDQLRRRQMGYDVVDPCLNVFALCRQIPSRYSPTTPRPACGESPKNNASTRNFLIITVGRQGLGLLQVAALFCDWLPECSW